MSYVSELEDINSILMTATQSLMEKYNIPASAIVRLEVGTETLIDKSKSASVDPGHEIWGPLVIFIDT